MRQYTIVITDPVTGDVLVPNFNNQPGFTKVPADPLLSTYTSLYPGASVGTIGGTNPNAQTCEMDIPVAYMHEPGQNSYIRMWGIGLAEIAQASQLNGLNIAIYGGMAAGLPLANFAQAGLLCNGQILQAFGNWVGVDQTLDIYMIVGGSSSSSNQTTGNPSSSSTSPLPTTNDHPANIVFQMKQGQSMIAAITACLQNAFPQYNIQGAISPNLVWNKATATGYHNTLRTFAAYLNQKSQSMLGGYAPDGQLYPGVQLSLQNNTITISDTTTQLTPKQIQFIDLVGQPTWSQPFTIQLACVMRYDINVGDFVTLPNGPGTTDSGANSQFFQPGASQGGYVGLSSNSAFSGTFQVQAVRHVGNSRQAGALSWVSTFDIAYQQPPTGGGTVVDNWPSLYSNSGQYNYHLPGDTS